MSDAPVEKSSNSSLCLTNSEKKIATLKERLSQDQSINKVNGTNGSSHNSEKSIAKMSETGNKLKDIMTNGISAQSSSANLSNLKAPFNMSSKSPSQANGKSIKGQMHAPSDSRVNIGSKISLPAGMSVTPLGPRYDQEDEESDIDDDEDGLDDSSPDGYGDDDSSDVIQLDPSTSNSPTPGSSGFKKYPANSMPQRRNNMSDNEEDEEDEDIEEVQDSSSDSDIMEVDAEDSLSSMAAPKSLKTKEDNSKGTFSSTAGKTNVVTIDDMSTLKALADSAKINKHVQNDKTNATLLEANRILSGRQSSGVTITPAVRALPPGLTISQSKTSTPINNTNGGKLPLPAGISVSPANQPNNSFHSPNPSKITGQLDDPNLTDDTFVVEAPSFIVPYVYEKPPKESIKDFKVSIEKLEDKIKKEKDCDEKQKESKSPKKDDKESQNKSEKDDSLKDKTEANGKENDSMDTGEAKKTGTPESKDVKAESTDSVKKKADSFFDSSLGKLFYGLGMNLVQETVQNDLLNEQQRKARKDKSATIMHAIRSLKVNIEQSKQKNQAFHMDLKKCRFCSFRTESQVVLDHHMETPHMKGTNYRCNVCKMETKTAQEVMSHMFVEHGVRARLERAAAINQCTQCPFEDNQKGKLTRHKVGCDKRFRGERNQEPPHDWEPPAKIPKPAILPHQKYQHGRNALQNVAGFTPQQQLAHQMAAKNSGGYSALQQQQLQLQQLASAGMRQMPPLQQMGQRAKGQNTTKSSSHALAQQMRQGGFPMGMKNGKPVYMQSSYAQNHALMQAFNQGNSRQQTANQAASMLLPNLGNNSSVTIQSIGSRSTNKSAHSPSISITPLPGGRGQSSSNGKNQSPQQQAMKPGQPGSNQGKSGFVICEICDGYIKDLEQLRNHMQWIHKVKIHPKMIYNRPPLNCQKCQFRFFTDQGLERHLLGSHGLVTASMQDLANKGQDSGRCPVCGKVYQWKLLNHVAKDHMKVLKPAHLSYKCTVCTATFGQYKLFENHVYTAHSGGAKKANASGGSSVQKASGSSHTTNPKQPIKVSDEITIIPQKKNTPLSNTANAKPATSWNSNSAIAQQAVAAKRNADTLKEDPDVIDLDDEEEIDDDEPQKSAQPDIDKKQGEAISLTPSKSAAERTHNSLKQISNKVDQDLKKAKLMESVDESSEGVEQVEEIEEDDD